MKKAVHIPHSLIDASLKASPTDGKKLLEPLKAFSNEHKAPIHVLENHNKSNPSEIHVTEADLWIVLEGTPEFIVGGTIVNGKAKVRKDGTTDDNEILGDGIDGGETYLLGPGDILYIPASVPHLHRSEGTVRMYIIKIREV